jgi:hypothetical protein
LAEDLEIDENGRQGQYLTRTNFLISI